MSNKPDKIVREPEIRAAVDGLTKGMADSSRAVGAMPSMSKIRAFVVPAVMAQVAKHEAMAAKGGLDAKPKPNADPLRVTEATTQHMGSFDWDPNTNQFTALGKVHPKLAKRIADARALTPGEQRIEMLRRDRAMLLVGGKYPDWEKKFHDAYFAGAQKGIMARLNRGEEVHSAEAYREIESAAADGACEVVDQSNAIFGDWREPPRVPNKVTVS